jgi:hypothetical protein
VESFDTSGATERITQSLQTRLKAFCPNDYEYTEIKNFNGAIGVKEDGTIDGVDIVVPSFKFTIQKSFAKSDITTSFRQTIAGLTGKVNESTFWGYPQGEVLFTGASGQRSGNGDWQISFNFLQSPTQYNKTLAGVTISQKQGWEYVWVHYKKLNQTLDEVPANLFVERIYEESDFSVLNLGEPS